MPAFFHEHWDPNSGPHACAGATFPPEAAPCPPQTQNLKIRDLVVLKQQRKKVLSVS